jgi:hypothetical protein
VYEVGIGFGLKLPLGLKQRNGSRLRLPVGKPFKRFLPDDFLPLDDLAQIEHVMMEKPLAVSMEHARRMRETAQRDHIHVIVNYETTWYPSNQLAFQLVQQQGAIGAVRKIVVRSGHQGPKEIGCPESFLDWLTDPVLNGGGALMDFGCYGAQVRLLDFVFLVIVAAQNESGIT